MKATSLGIPGLAAVLMLLATPVASLAETAKVANVPWGVYLLKAGDYSAAIIGTVRLGEEVEVLDSKSVPRYVQVRCKGKTGWIGRKYLAFQQPPVLVPVRPPVRPSNVRPPQDDDPFSELNRTDRQTQSGQGGTEASTPPPDPRAQARQRYEDSMVEASEGLWAQRVRFDDFGDDAVDNDGDWQELDEEAALDPKDADKISDDTGADGIPESGDVGRVTAQALWLQRYQNKPVAGGESDGRPTPGEPDVDANDPDERNTYDGTHLRWMNDGVDNNHNGRIDEPEETYLVCIDLPRLALQRSGYDLTKLMAADARKNPRRYNPSGRGTLNSADDPYLSRRLSNVIKFMRADPRFYYFPEENLRSIDARPRTAFRTGDVVFFGHADVFGTSKFYPEHSGVVTEVDPETGMPTRVVSVRSDGARDDHVDERFFRNLIIVGHGRPRF